MFKRVSNLWLMAVLAITIPLMTAGCSDDDDPTSPAQKGSAFVRVAHLSPDAPIVDIWVDGSVALQDVAYGDFSSYLKLDEGTHRVHVSPASQTSPIVIDAQVTLDADKHYTVAATGRLASIAPIVLADDLTRSASQARVRFVHAGPDAPTVDITLTDGTVLFPAVDFRENAGYISVPPGTVDLQVRLAGTETVALSFADVPLAAGNVYSVFAVGLLSDGSIQGKVAIDDPNAGNATVDLEPATARLRVAHLSPDAPGVDIYLDDQLVNGLTNVPFKTISGYLSTGAATHNLKIYVAGSTTNPVIEADATLLPGVSYTAAATGLVGQADLHPLILVDDREGAAAGKALVRFVHLSPDAPNVDIRVAGGSTLFSNVGFRGFAGYEEVPSGSYNLEVRLASGGTIALSLPGVTLGEGASHSVFAVGLAGDASLDAILVRDAP
jgi:hypothetical protein